MDIERTIVFNISQEELFTILSYLGLPGMMGLDGSIFNRLSEEQIQFIVSAAERALVARGFLELVPTQQPKPIPIVLSVLAACTNAEHSLIVLRNQTDITIPYFFHITKEMVVIHTLLFPGIHQFAILINREKITETAIAILSMVDVATLICPDGKLLESELTQAREWAQQGREELILNSLSQNGLQENTRAALAFTLAHLIANTTFVSIHHDEDHNAQGFTLLQGENGLWLLRPVEGEAQEYVSVTPISVVQAEAEVQNLLS